MSGVRVEFRLFKRQCYLYYLKQKEYENVKLYRCYEKGLSKKLLRHKKDVEIRSATNEQNSNGASAAPPSRGSTSSWLSTLQVVTQHFFKKRMTKWVANSTKSA